MARIQRLFYTTSRHCWGGEVRDFSFQEGGEHGLRSGGKSIGT